jgi:hypothetical protein
MSADTGNFDSHFSILAALSHERPQSEDVTASVEYSGRQLREFASFIGHQGSQPDP